MGASGRTIVPDVKSFRAHPSALFEIRQFVRDRAAAAALSEQLTNDLLLAVSEAAANSIIHTTTADIQLRWSMEAECVAIRESIRRNRPFGSESWVEQTSQVLGLESSLRGSGRPVVQAK